MTSAKVIQLRALLTDKIPGLRLSLEESPAVENGFRPTGLPQLDEPLQGGLPRGALSEIVCGQNHGGATLIRALLQQAARQKLIVAFIDGSDALDVTQIEEYVLSRLLWVRCHAAEEALKAADLVLRDGNLPFVLLDLQGRPERELRKIPGATWYRFQRLVEQTSAVCLILSPRALAGSAQTRITLHSRFSLDALERDADDLLRELTVKISDDRQFAGTSFTQSIA